MKKGLLVLLMLGLLCLPAMADATIPYENVFASWLTAGVSTNTNIAIGAESRNIWIHNGSAIDICINLNGTTVSAACTATDGNFQLNGTESIYIENFKTNAVSFTSMGVAASPVSIVVTY